MIEQTDDHMKMARRVVSARLQAFFAELRQALDPDSEDFFQRVMQQTKLQSGGDVIAD